MDEETMVGKVSVKKTDMPKTVSESIFRNLDTMHAELTESESREAVEAIINVLKGMNITFDCAHEILRATDNTLGKMMSALTL